MAASPLDFLPTELLPPNCTFANPSHMHVADRKAAVIHWPNAGYIKVLRVKSGSKLADALIGSAASAPRRALNTPPPLDAAIVNRYGCRGRSLLQAAGIALYTDEPDVLNDAVMEDDLGDPIELLRTEDEEHTHLAPCTVPESSEARAQYCLTLLQLVKDDDHRERLIGVVKLLLALPVSPTSLGNTYLGNVSFGKLCISWLMFTFVDYAS